MIQYNPQEPSSHIETHQHNMMRIPFQPDGAVGVQSALL